MNKAIEVTNISKSFKLPHEQHSGVKQSFVNAFNTDRGFEIQEVLNDINFDVEKGGFFGIVGRNGSGKSTLLKILAGIYTNTTGKVKINGSLTPFIELGVGFNPELTGRENVFLNGALLGFSRKEVAGMYNEIVKFAELEKFMDQKLKNYSSGMQVRLAFSIAVQAKSDILLIDEVLAVGDAAFQQKCFDYFKKLKDDNKTVVLVSHDIGSLERFCNKGVLIENGKIISRGDIKDVLKDYSRIVLGHIELEVEEKTEEKVKDQRITRQEKTKTDHARITSLKILDKSGKSQRKFSFGEPIFINYKIKVGKDLSSPIAGITIWDKEVDKALMATNTSIEGLNELENLKAGQLVDITIELLGNLNNGEYIVEPAVANSTATIFYDQIPNATSFMISGSNNPHSILSSEKKMKIKVAK